MVDGGLSKSFKKTWTLDFGNPPPFLDLIHLNAYFLEVTLHPYYCCFYYYCCY